MDWDLSEKLTIPQLVKKFLAFYGTRRFITAFKNACYLSLLWATWIQSMPPSHFSKIHFNIILPSMPESFKCSSSLRFPHQTLCAPLVTQSSALKHWLIVRRGLVHDPAVSIYYADLTAMRISATSRWHTRNFDPFISKAASVFSNRSSVHAAHELWRHHSISLRVRKNHVWIFCRWRF
jgi:hypothetical protein